MNQCFLKKITDYWDSNSNAIETWGRTLHEMDRSEWADVEANLRDSIIEHTRVLSDQIFERVVFIVVDDLYKTANTITFWSDAVEAYLRATAGVFMGLVSQRGYSLHYVVDNSFNDTVRPYQLFPTWFSASGIGYICPQLVSLEEGCSISEARQKCTSKLNVSGADKHYLILDIDSADDSFLAPLEQLNNKNVITVIRTEAPEPGSHIEVFLSGQPLGSGR